jgi:hypothetical protein
MKSRYGCLTLIVLAVIIGLAIGIGGADINNSKDVIERMQGSWTGYDHEGGIYTHYKLVINGNSFKGWMQTAYTNDTPNFASSPDVTGTYTLSPVQGYTNSSGKYRNINFTMEGGGFGNNSLSARSFTNMIIYDNSVGLYVVGWAAMSREGGVGTWQGWTIFIGLALALFFEVKARLFGEGKTTNPAENEVANPTNMNKQVEPTKSTKPIETYTKESSSVNEGFISSNNLSQSKRSLEELRQAKDLLDAGVISHDEFDAIKIEALGKKPIVKIPHAMERPTVFPLPPKIKKVAHSVIDTKGKKAKVKPVIILLVVLVMGIGCFYTIQLFNRTNEEQTTSESQKLPEQNGGSERETQFLDNMENIEVVDSSLYSNQPDFTKRYTGTINNKYKIDLTLTKEGTDLTGSYFYVGKNSKLFLTGQIENDGSFMVEEVSSGNVTGKFTGKLVGNTATGTWSDRSGKTTLPFTISEVNTSTAEFFTTTEGLRYKKLVIQVPNHDEAGTISQLEVVGPVEGMYISKNDGKTRSLQISYNGDKIYVLHWNDSGNAKREDAYVTSKGYLAFGNEEFEYDRYGETVMEVKNLSLVERFTGQVFVWNSEWQGD